MKKLIKLHINQEKLMKDEELKTLNGGSNHDGCLCFCLTVMGEPLGSLFSPSETCVLDCQLAFGIVATGYCMSY